MKGRAAFGKNRKLFVIIGLRLLCNPICAQKYNEKQFSILAKGRSPFHLIALEAIFIKTSNPILCRQKNLFTISHCSRI